MPVVEELATLIEVVCPDADEHKHGLDVLI
jgi:hypothetical protein